VVMYPLWPMSMRVAVWYLSVTVLLTILGFTALQLTVFGASWLVGWELWLLPNLWSDAPPSELLKPLVSLERSENRRVGTRLAILAVVAAAVWYVAAQTPDMNTFLAQQKKLVDDLYAGTLLGDGSAAASAAGAGGTRRKYSYSDFNQRGPAIPDINDMEKMFRDEDAAAASSAGAAAGSGADGAPGEPDTTHAPPAAHTPEPEAEPTAVLEADAPDMDALLEAGDDGAAAATSNNEL